MYYSEGMMKLSQQAEIDRRMCKPGYQWLEMPWTKRGGKCVGGYAGDGAPDVDKPPTPTPPKEGGIPTPVPMPPPPTDGNQPGDAMIAKEVATRKAVK